MIENPIGFVGVNSQDGVILFIDGKQIGMTKAQAIDLAVRLVALSDDFGAHTFSKVLSEFMNT